ncbi:hypothetical protein [Curtobacterium oceanosedimentum]|uniref:hypothetical protein n=1 Tax=Curtobacterium oceanosedimentum TaxID=465820 RepID=UPI001CE1E86C|nr:hypothetical protein [Curtobacterium oceanosedimentum]MCA5922531.1 hypothetical protein [Curtobacterium oceanosedimentum]
MKKNQVGEPSTEHDPYARRPGFVTGVDGRTDRTTTAMVAGIAAAAVGLFISGLLQIAEWIAFPACAAVGVAVWLVLRARQRRREERAGRSPDAVSEARDRATAEANGGRRFFIATNPVVVIVMGVIFLGLASAPLLSGDVSVGRVVVAVAVGVSGVATIGQGAGTLILQRRQKASAPLRSSGSADEREV